MAKPFSLESINNIFVSKLKTNKEVQAVLSNKYRSILDNDDTNNQAIKTT
jgi:hypothetical protein